MTANNRLEPDIDSAAIKSVPRPHFNAGTPIYQINGQLPSQDLAAIDQLSRALTQHELSPVLDPFVCHLPSPRR